MPEKTPKTPPLGIEPGRELASEPGRELAPEPGREPWWPQASSPPPGWLGPLALAIGLFAGLTWALARPGLHWAVTAAAVGGAVAVRARGSRSVDDLVLLGLAVALVSVGAVSDSLWLVSLCLVAGVGAAAAAALGARNWAGTLLAVPALGVAWVLSLPWWGGLVPRVSRGRAVLSWVRGAIAALFLVVVFSVLLGSADPGFADLVGSFVPRVSFARLPLQFGVFLVAVGMVLALAYAAVSAPRWERLSPRPRRRPAAEWLVPLAAVDGVLLVFGVLQLDLLFGTYSPQMYRADVTYSERVHQGFWQLVVVTLLTLALLGWAAGSANAASYRHRTGLSVAGGLLVALALGVVASALRRLWLYEQAYGWTVLRLNVGVFEVWLGVVLVVVAVAWVLRRGAVVARAVVLSAAGTLLVLAAAGPDALVARWNVDRLRDTGKVDVGYLRKLSADAVPELARLPEPYRGQALGGRRIDGRPSYAVNLARVRARAVLGSGRADR